MVKVQLPGSQKLNKHMEIHTSTHNSDVSLKNNFKSTHLMHHTNMVFWIIGNPKKLSSK